MQIPELTPYTKYNITGSCIKSLQNRGMSILPYDDLKERALAVTESAVEGNLLLAPIDTGNGENMAFVVKMEPTEGNHLDAPMYLIFKEDADYGNTFAAVAAWTESYYNKQRGFTGTRGGVKGFNTVRAGNGFSLNNIQQPPRIHQRKLEDVSPPAPLSTVEKPVRPFVDKTPVPVIAPQRPEAEEPPVIDTLEEFVEAVQKDYMIVVVSRADSKDVLLIRNASSKAEMSDVVSDLIDKGFKPEQLRYFEKLKPKVKVVVEF